MKCPNCGAEIEPGKTYCGSCGSQISLEMKQEQEKLNKVGCPKCGSSNVTFNREKNGEIKGKNRTTIVRSTVGLCKDCGYTWQTDEQNKQRKTWLWVLGWIFIFPLPLTILILRKKDMKPVMKYGIIVAAWLVFLLIGFAGGSGNSNKTMSEQTTTPSIVESTQREKTDGLKTEAPVDSSSSVAIDEMAVLQAFYEDFSSNGTLANLKDMVSHYGLYTDNRKDGLGHDTYKVAYTKELAKVISNTDLATAGNYVVIRFNLLQNDKVDSITFHTDADVVDESAPAGPTEMNSLLQLFATLDNTTTREEIDAYIAENGLVKYAFTDDSAYYIGFENSAIKTRGRDREGEAIDINFVTSGDFSKLGMVISAEYAVHTGFSTHTALKYDDGVFYFEGEKCSDGKEAVQRFLAAQ